MREISSKDIKYCDINQPKKFVPAKVCKVWMPLIKLLSTAEFTRDKLDLNVESFIVDSERIMMKQLCSKQS